MATDTTPEGHARHPLALRVEELRYLAKGVVGVTLVDPGGAALPAWTPGAHIDIVLPSGATRSYSLCGTPDAAHYRIAVLLETAGRGASREIHEQPMVGRILAVSDPRNLFELVEAPHLVFIAAGIGITPLMPMLRQVAAAQGSWEMHYLGRSRDAMSFLDELATYANHPGGRLDIIARDERERATLATILAAAPDGSAVYCCGPDGLLAEVESLCGADPRLQLHLERFGRPVLAPLAEPPESGAPATQDGNGDGHGDGGDTDACDPDGPFQVELRKTGITLDVGPGDSILGLARQVRTGLSFSCSDGYCGTCETRILAGIPDHRDTVLTEEEKAENQTMMICVGRSRTRRLVLDL